MAVGDFNGDGYLDLATANISSDDISILLGNGDGTFQPAAEIPLPGFQEPTAIVAAEFNGDGRLDLAVAGDSLTEGYGVDVLLGNGDGTFEPPTFYPVGGIDPVALVAAQFRANGPYDLATANIVSNNVSILMGNGNGTFETAQQFPPSGTPNPLNEPDSLVAGDFTTSGDVDLAVANFGSGTVSILTGDGAGGFEAIMTPITVGRAPQALVAGDFADNGIFDLAVADSGTNSVTILVRDKQGVFHAENPPIQVGSMPYALAVGHFTNSSMLDLAVANYGSDDVSILIGNGNGTFDTEPLAIPVGTEPSSLVAQDFTSDGNLDLAVANAASNDVSVLLGDGQGRFVPVNQTATATHATPLVVDVNGDGTDDTLVVDGAGQILYRQQVAGQAGTFEPPVVVNPAPTASGSPNAPNPYASSGIAWIPDTIYGPVIASVDADNNFISLFAFEDGAFALIGSLPSGALHSQIAAADLSGDGWDDLVVWNAGGDTLGVYYNVNDSAGPTGRFTGPVNPGSLAFDPVVAIPVGVGVSDVQAIDTTGDGRLDLVVTNSASGQVRTLANLGGGTFADAANYRAGTGFSEVDPSGSPPVSSEEGTDGVAGGPFETGAPTGLVTINPGTYSLGVLAGLGGGDFANPSTIETAGPRRPSSWPTSVTTESWISPS